ncbi:ankyrin repeat-containing domain protein [Nemania sp. FL0031]|nr:ankyrin repeat-containing domain protein [Nemania sp. FL0031]
MDKVSHNSKGQTLLARAAKAGIAKAVAILLDHTDVDVDVRDYDGHTAVVAQLLARGADPNLRDQEQVAPLWRSAKNGHAAVVRLLLASGRLSDLNTQPIIYEHRSDTPLTIAVRQGHQELAGLLARAEGVDPYIKPTWRYGGFSILGLAILNGREDAALALLERCGLGQVSDDGGPSNMADDAIEPASKLLVFAAGSGSTRIIRELLDKHGADVNAVYRYYQDMHNKVEQSPLMAASRRGDACVVRLLLDTQGISPDLSAGYNKNTALTLAAQGGFSSVVKLLVADARVDVNHKDYDGRTSLSYAAERSHEAVVAELLAAETVDPNSQDNKGRTPLIWAVNQSYQYRSPGRQPCEGVVRRLLVSGRVNPNSMDALGCTPLSYAAQDGSLQLVRAIIKNPETDLNAGGGYITPVASATRSSYVDARLRRGECDINVISKNEYDGGTALAVAAGLGHKRVVQILLSTPGINPNSKDRHGRTPLMTAAAGGQVKIVKRLLRVVGIDLNIQNRYGQTALCSAAMSSSTRAAEVMRVLIKIPDIKIDLANNIARTALSLAMGHGRVECVDRLLGAGANPDARDAAGRSPLSWALVGHWARDGHQEAVQHLLRILAVDPNVEDDEGLTPLLRAIQLSRSSEFVELLLARADLEVNRRGRDGLSPLALAQEKGNTVVIALLRARGAIMSGEPAPSDEAVLLDIPIPCDSGDSGVEYPMDKSIAVESTRGLVISSVYVGDRFRRKLIRDSDRQELMALREKLARKYRLFLGAQHEYVGEWAAESAKGLCRVCAAIDLDAAFSRRHTNYRGRVVAKLGRVDKTWETRRCPLCRLFAAARPRPNVGGKHKLVSFSTTQSWLCHEELTWWFGVENAWIDTMVLAVVANSVLRGLPYVSESEKDLLWPDRAAAGVVNGVFSAGLISRLGSNCPYKANAITTPRLAADGCDLSVARGWIRCCRENHSQQCNPCKLATVPHLRLIECATRRIVEHKEFEAVGTPLYVALSYVWGQPSPTQSKKQQQQEQHSFGEEGSGVVEATIEDAIRVTLELGYGYLWVDRYCIMQMGNESIKQEQLRHMHTVYINAEVTLVAAAGGDASAGLPGAPGRPRRTRQPSALVQGHALVCIPPDPSRHIRSTSTWATRGWTFQEGLLARRRLFFSEYEMSYECRDMLCREALRLPPAVQHVSGRIPSLKQPIPRLMEPFWMYKPSSLTGVKDDDTGDGLFGLLEAYSPRELSLPSDTLNGMLGIFQLLSEHKDKPVYHVCGVPILYIGGNESDSNGDGTAAARRALDGFLNGHCWDLQQPASRRHGFPSWSWAGWKGVVERIWLTPNIRQAHGFEVDISIIPRGRDRTAVPWNCYYDQLRTADESSKDIWSGQHHILEITASTVTVQLRVSLKSLDEAGDWTGTVCANGGVWKGKFSLTSKADGDGDNHAGSLRSTLLQKQWTGIVLGNSSLSLNCENTYRTYVLVVQEQQQKQLQSVANTEVYWERIGLLKLTDCILKDNMLERRTWRLA